MRMAFCPKGHVKTTLNEAEFVLMEEGWKDKVVSLIGLDEDEDTAFRLSVRESLRKLVWKRWLRNSKS